MARLYEYQGKMLFKENGIAVPSSVHVSNMEEIEKKQKSLSYPLVAKSQILSGRRGKRGGIKFVNDESELIEISEMLMEKFKSGLLLEEKLDIEQEFYFSITGDASSRGLVIMLSQMGGMNVEKTFGESEKSVIRNVSALNPLYLYQARDIAIQAGVKGKDISQIARVIVSAFNLYKKYDCTLLEINPLCIVRGKAIAVDSKVNLDDDALYRHKDLGLDVFEDSGEREPTQLELAAGEIDQNDHRGSVHFVQLDPDLSLSKKEGRVPIGFDGVGGGSSMVMFDELIPLGYQPINFCDTSGNPVGAKMYRITRIILAQQGIEGYIFAICVPSSQQNDNVVRGIIKAFKEVYNETDGEPNIPMVLAVGGTYGKEAYRVLEQEGYTNYPFVRVMYDVTHQEAAEEFDKIYKEWKEKI